MNYQSSVQGPSARDTTTGVAAGLPHNSLRRLTRRTVGPKDGNRRIRTAAVLALFLSTAAAMFPHGAHALGLQTSESYDFAYSDGVSTTPLANDMANKVRSASMNAYGYTNYSASFAAPRVAQDTFFYFVGHTQGFTDNGAIVFTTLMFESGGQSSNMASNKDDCTEAAPLYQLVLYCPTAMQPLQSLAVLQGCSTALPDQLDGDSLADGFYNVGAESVVGFYDPIYANPSAGVWERSFYSHWAGGSYAVVDAGNAATAAVKAQDGNDPNDGYGTMRIKGNAYLLDNYH